YTFLSKRYFLLSGSGLGFIRYINKTTYCRYCTSSKYNHGCYFWVSVYFTWSGCTDNKKEGLLEKSKQRHSGRTDRNNVVAEELTLKANEIARKKSDFLEGTYLFHGIEEVMNADEVVVIVDPFKDEEEKYKNVLIKGIGLKVVAISTRKTIFPTMIIPEYGDFTNYLEIAAGWNLLVEIGINMGIDMDKTVRARKVGHKI
ncbi:hypothetical protein KKA86_03430, partial [bacterium]|nr:hypothetical protein [bacterium]